MNPRASFRPLLLAAAVLCIVAAPAPAQLFSCDINPNPATVGSPITYTVSCTQPVGLSTGCGLSAVHQGTPNGPVVYAPFICPLIFISVGPGLTYTGTWQGTDNNGLPVPPGLYYLRFNGTLNNPTGGPVVGYFPVRIDDPANPNPDPVMSVLGTASPGSTLTLQISDPSEPFGAYLAAASLTTNTGAVISPSLWLALDFDFLWSLSFPSPDPAFFANLLGNLDNAGLTTSPQMFIPNVPALSGFPLAFQAAVFGASTLRMTNPVTRYIP